MYFELFVAAVMIGTFVYHRWIEDHPASPRPTDVQLPRVDEGTPITMVYGRCRVRTPVMVWSGNYLVPGDEYDTSPSGTATADHYSLDTLFILGVPFYGGKAALTGAWAGDTPITMHIDASAGTTQRYDGGPGGTPTDFSVNGVFYQGTTIQDVTNGTPSIFPDTGTFIDGVNYRVGLATGTTALVAMLFAGEDSTRIPGYRSQLVLFSHVAIGGSPALPAFSFEVQALSTGSAADLGRSLPTDGDPAAVLLDLLTSPWAKLALPVSKIDLPSFNAASITLFAEGHGYSRAIDQGADASEIIGDVLKQTDGLIYEEPTTGKLVYKLVRKDYVIPELDDINPDNASPAGSGWYSVQGWSETINQVRVKFTDRQNFYADGLAIGQNQANIIGQGGKLRSLELTYVGCCDRILAAKLASRELGAVSRPIAKASVIVNRSFYAKRPGDVVTLTWPEIGVDHMIMRVVRVDFGQLHDGRIKIDIIRDVFDVQLGAFAFAA